jgi:hypothetical protein
MALDAGEVDELRQYIQHLGIERALRVYYNIYRAFVIDNADPDMRGRIRIACPQVGHDPQQGLQTMWVDPLFDAAGNNFGAFFPPVTGSLVRVFFDNGNPSTPIGYFGGWYTQTSGKFPLPTEFAYAADGTPQKRGFVTRAGHQLIFNDEAGKESISIIWHQPDPGDEALSDVTKTADRTKGITNALVFGPNNAFQLIVEALDKSASTILTIDPNTKTFSVVDQTGNSISTSPSGINIVDAQGNLMAIDSGSGNLNVVMSGDINFTGKSFNAKVGGVFLGDMAMIHAVLGEPLMTWLTSHMHGTGVGPSTPPTVPPPPAILSQNVKLK